MKLVKRIELGNGKCTYDFSNESVGEFIGDHEKGVNALFERVYELENAVCHWKYHDNEDVYETECGNLHVFMVGRTPEDNYYVFCPYCGRKIEVEDEKCI